MEHERRPRASTEAKRLAILDATEELILEHGYAAVSSRRVAERVGIKPPHLHYYFPKIDDLFVALLHRRSGRAVERLGEALDSPEPLTAWWRQASDRRGTALFIELLAAANHRPALGAEIGAMAAEVRELQMARLADLLPEYGLDPGQFPPALIAATVQGLAFALVSDETAGYATHTDQADAGMTGLLASLEQRRRDRLAGG